MADSFDVQAQELLPGLKRDGPAIQKIAAALRAADAKARAEGEAAGEARGLERAAAEFASMQVGPRGGECHLAASFIVRRIRALAQPPPEGEK